MSGDVAMLSDDDRPLVNKAGSSTQNGHALNGNGNGNGAVDDTSSMSEDDDMPLSQSTRLKSEPATPDVRSLKRKKPAYESSSEDDTPLASAQNSPMKPKTAAVPMPGALLATTVPLKALSKTKSPPKTPSEAAEDSDFEDEKPIAKRKRATAPPKAKGKAKAKPAKKKVKKEESDEDDDVESEDDKPIPPPKRKRPSAVKKEESEVESEDDKPLKKAAPKKAAAKKVKKEESSGSEDDKPLKKAAPKKSSSKKAKKEESEEPATSKGKKRAKKEEANGSPSKKAKAKKEEEEEEQYRWWEAQNADGDGSIKWNTLEHNGVYFPPPYVPLPPEIKMKYNHKRVDLPPAAEEVAGFYAALLESDHAKDINFNNNFFDDFLTVLKKNPPRDGTKITKLELCDFRPMFEYFEDEKAKKKALTTAEKKELKAEKDKLEAPYTHCTLDGRKEKVGNFRVEPPGLFRGRGEHPKKGALKFRVRPEDITINIGKNSPVPVPNVPGKWKAVQHDQTVTWLANWTENVNGNHKYVFLAAGSSIKGQSDMAKFDKAKELKKYVDQIRADYTEDLKSKVMQDRQMAVALYLIDRLALRAGNEKGEEEADTVGCCSLRCEHVTLDPPNFVVFDFLGKDSIRYYNRVAVDEQVFKSIRVFKNNKEDVDMLFDRVDTPKLNKALQGYMKGLTAKVFRTYNASFTFQQQLDSGTPEKGTLQEKLNAYNHANRMVAILCNHQRAVPKTHEQSMGKMKEKLRGFKYERMKLRHALFGIDPKFKKNKLYKEDESDLDDDAIAEHEEQWRAKEIEKAEKKFAKENEKLKEDKKEEQEDSVLKARIKDIETEFKKLKKERGTSKAELKRERPTDKIEENIEKLDEKIKAFKLQMLDREAGKEVALGTSKINYLDPRITAAWCKKYDVPIEKLFSKTLLTKFPWALEVDEDWKF